MAKKLNKKSTEVRKKKEEEEMKKRHLVTATEMRNPYAD
jgi:hypothetical protein